MVIYSCFLQKLILYFSGARDGMWNYGHQSGYRVEQRGAERGEENVLIYFTFIFLNNPM